MELQKAIVRTGTSLIDKHAIRHLKAFRIAVLKEGPDLDIFTHPFALSKLALWISDAINVYIYCSYTVYGVLIVKIGAGT